MRCPRIRSVLVLFCLLPGAGAVAEAPRGASLGSVAWLAGCWESRRGERHVEEQWMAPEGGSMLGMGRTVRGERTVEFEFMRIDTDGDALVFTSRPSGQAEASFRSVRITDSSVLFENLEHDFPQRILYERQKDGSLLARIEGKDNGTDMQVEFPMTPARCPGRRS